MKTRKSWREKMDDPKLPKIVDIPPRMQKRYGEGKMVIPSPNEVDALIREVRKGKVTTVSKLRELLAAQHDTQVACPLCTGIFLRIASEAAEEDAAAGKKTITPYWRVVAENGALNPKFPGGVERQAERLKAEGHRIVAGKVQSVR
jgi:hypothetical protein